MQSSAMQTSDRTDPCVHTHTAPAIIINNLSITLELLTFFQIHYTQKYFIHTKQEVTHCSIKKTIWIIVFPL